MVMQNISLTPNRFVVGRADHLTVRGRGISAAWISARFSIDPFDLLMCEEDDAAPTCSAVAAEQFVDSMTEQQFADFVTTVESSAARPRIPLRPVVAR